MQMYAPLALGLLKLMQPWLCLTIRIGGAKSQ